MGIPAQIKSAKRLVSTYESAKKRSKDFNLGLSYLTNIIAQTRCAYSGELFEDNQGPDSMTLERFDNDVGYIEGNVIPVKKRYNSLRSSLELPEVIEKRDVLTARIVRAADAKVLNVNGNPSGKKRVESEDLKKARKMLGRINANIKGREAALLTCQSDELRKSLQARIDGGKAEAERIKLRIAKMESAAGQAKGPSEAEQRAHEYNMIIRGLTRFQKLSFLDRKKLNKGLPLEASLLQLIRGKM